MAKKARHVCNVLHYNDSLRHRYCHFFQTRRANGSCFHRNFTLIRLYLLACELDMFMCTLRINLRATANEARRQYPRSLGFPSTMLYRGLHPCDLLWGYPHTASCRRRLLQLTGLSYP